MRVWSLAATPTMPGHIVLVEERVVGSGASIVPAIAPACVRVRVVGAGRATCESERKRKFDLAAGREAGAA